jgi:hypothetical protein
VENQKKEKCEPRAIQQQQPKKSFIQWRMRKENLLKILSTTKSRREENSPKNSSVLLRIERNKKRIYMNQLFFFWNQKWKVFRKYVNYFKSAVCVIVKSFKKSNSKIERKDRKKNNKRITKIDVD